MKKNTIFVGLDVHKDSIEVAFADDGRDGEIRSYGSIGGDLESLHKVVRKLQSKGATLRFVYEAGPCGYEIYRSLKKKGFNLKERLALLSIIHMQWKNHLVEFCHIEYMANHFLQFKKK